MASFNTDEQPQQPRVKDQSTEENFAVRTTKPLSFSIETMRIMDSLPDISECYKKSRLLNFPSLQILAIRMIALTIYGVFRVDKLKYKFNVISEETISCWLRKTYDLVSLPRNVICSDIAYSMYCIDYELYRYRLDSRWMDSAQIDFEHISWNAFGKIDEIETFYNLVPIMTREDVYIYAAKLCLRDYMLSLPRELRNKSHPKYVQLECVLFWSRYCTYRLDEFDHPPTFLSNRSFPSLRIMMSEATTFGFLTTIKYIWNVMVSVEGRRAAFRYLLGHNIVSNEDVCSFFLTTFTEDELRELFNFYNTLAVLKTLCKLWPTQNILIAIFDMLLEWGNVNVADYFSLLTYVAFQSPSNCYPLQLKNLQLFTALWNRYSDRLVDCSPLVIHETTSLIFRAFEDGNKDMMNVIKTSRAYQKIRAQVIFGETAKQKYLLAVYKTRQELMDFFKFLDCAENEIDAICVMYRREMMLLQKYSLVKARLFTRLDHLLLSSYNRR